MASPIIIDDWNYYYLHQAKGKARPSQQVIGPQLYRHQHPPEQTVVQQLARECRFGLKQTAWLYQVSENQVDKSTQTKDPKSPQLIAKDVCAILLPAAIFLTIFRP